MSITNRSIDVKASTADLNTLLSDYEGQLDAILGRPEDEIDGADVEWLESGIEIIEGELELRHEAEEDRRQQLHDEMVDDMLAQDGRWG